MVFTLRFGMVSRQSGIVVSDKYGHVKCYGQDARFFDGEGCRRRLAVPV